MIETIVLILIYIVLLGLELYVKRLEKRLDNIKYISQLDDKILLKNK